LSGFWIQKRVLDLNWQIYLLALRRSTAPNSPIPPIRPISPQIGANVSPAAREPGHSARWGRNRAGLAAGGLLSGSLGPVGRVGGPGYGFGPFRPVGGLSGGSPWILVGGPFVLWPLSAPVGCRILWSVLGVIPSVDSSQGPVQRPRYDRTVARTVSCEVCERIRPAEVSAWAGWLMLEFADLRDPPRDFCSRECLTRWAEAM
jgi:hypothetical protein